MIGFIIGTMFGACAGVLLAGLLRAAKDGDANWAERDEAQPGEGANDNKPADDGKGVA